VINGVCLLRAHLADLERPAQVVEQIIAVETGQRVRTRNGARVTSIIGCSSASSNSTVYLIW